MNAATLSADLPRVRRPSRWSPRLVSAELLKLRKRRGLVVSALLLTIVPMLVTCVVLAGRDDPAGGLEKFRVTMNILPLLGVVAAILVGATVGTADVGSGVFRELVATGRSRLALFAARVPAGLGLLIPLVGIAYAIAATASTLLGGSLDAPNVTLLVESGGWLLLVTALSYTLALGVSSAVDSRGTSIALLLAWWFVVMPLLLGLQGLGRLREALLYAALDRIAPAALFDGDPTAPTSLAVAVVVIVLWTIVPLALGARRTCTRDA
jgi:hypothetical protein